MNHSVPNHMSRRHFLQHMATAAATVPALNFLSHLQANAAEVVKKQKACILMWMGGGPPTIDIWDLKPGSKNGGEFKPIDTKAPGVQISEHMPKTAMQFQDLSIIRAMSTREADHGRGRYFMHTGFIPNPTVVHPTFGSVVSYEIGKRRPELQIPAFVSIGGGAGSPGYMGMTNAAFDVDSNGNIRNADMGKLGKDRLNSRLSMLSVVENNFIGTNRGDSPKAHRDVYEKAVNLMISPQMDAFKVSKEDPKVLEAYGNNNFGKGLLMARRLVETGVPFIEVNLGGWDLHNDVFNTLRDQRLPTLDQGIGALDGGPAFAGFARTHHLGLDGRICPHAAYQPKRGPRPLGRELERDDGRRRIEERPSHRRNQCRWNRRRREKLCPRRHLGHRGACNGHSHRHRAHLQKRPSHADRRRRNPDQRTHRLNHPNQNRGGELPKRFPAFF